MGLLRQVQEIRNSEDNLRLQERTLARLEALLASEFIDIVQVDQFRQSVQSQRSSLLRIRNAFQLSLDRYKTTTLGLPPDIEFVVDDSLIRQFQLIPRRVTQVADGIAELQSHIAALPDDPSVQQVSLLLDEAARLVPSVDQLIQDAAGELATMNARVAAREASMAPEYREESRRERARLERLYNDMKGEFGALAGRLNAMRNLLNENTVAPTSRHLITWVADFLQFTERFALIPAQARLETVAVEPVQLEPEEAFRIALENRLDFMNGRAALVDQWRAIQVNADALQSVLDLKTSGEIRTARNNPFSFRAPTGSFRLGLEFDAPLTRLLERNAYREALIRYQQSRRALIQSQDALHLGIRALLRNLEQFRQDLEIQRHAVRIALRRVDQTQLSLSPPRQPPQPGQRVPINPTTAINLLSAQSSLLSAQNAFLAVWLDYLAARMRLYREMGVMWIDPEGRWVELPIHGAVAAGHPAGDSDGRKVDPATPEPLPPPAPGGHGGLGIPQPLPNPPNGNPG